jgi:hypothetical protein
VIRSWRVHPAWRSAEIRAPHEIIDTIAPNPVRPIM